MTLVGAASALYWTTLIHYRVLHFNTRQKNVEPARYVKQPTRYGEFCKIMLTDPYEETKREKFWGKKNLLGHVIQHRFQKPLLAVFQNSAPIRNAFFHPFGPLL